MTTFRLLRRVAAVAAVITMAGVATDYVPAHASTDGALCSGVGLGGPSASTSRNALDAFVSQIGGHPSDWKRTSTSGSHPHGGSASDGYSLVAKRQTAVAGFRHLRVTRDSGVWAVRGGC